MKRYIILTLLTIFVHGLFGQVNKFGTPVTKSYNTQITKGSENNWCITKDKFGTVYFGNDDNLVIRYDGSKWTTIPLDQKNTTIVRSLGSDENGIIYVGGINEFGYIMPDSSGNRTYISMTGRLSSAKDITYTGQVDTLSIKNPGKPELVVGEIKSLIVIHSTIYFLSPGALIIYYSDIDSLEYINLRRLGFRNCERLFYLNDKIILTNNNSGLFELKDGKLVQLPGGDFFSRKICLSILPYKENQVIVATLDAGIFLYNYSDGTIDGSFLDREMFDKLKELYVYCGVRLQTGEIVFGTTTDGLYIFDENGKYIGHWSSKNTNMQDNVILALYTDQKSNSELWISTSGSVTKAYTNLPFSELSEKDGLEGSINNFCKFNGSVYVATDNGLFKSGIDNDGTRRFINFNNINSQIFPLCVGTVGKDSFLLAGSTFDGLFKISSSGKSESLALIQAPSRIIFQSKFKNNRFYVGMTKEYINILEYNSGMWNKVGDISHLPGAPLNICELENGDLLVLTSYPDAIFRIPFNDSVSIKSVINPTFKYTTNKGIPESGFNSLSEDNGEYILSTNSGLLKLNKENDTWEPCDFMTGGYTKNLKVVGFYREPEGSLWVSTDETRHNDIMFSSEKDSVVMHKGGYLSLLPGLKFMITNSIEGKVWISKSKSIFIIDEEKLKEKLPEVQALMTKIVVSSHGLDSLVMNETFYKKGENGKRYPTVSNTGEKQPEFNFKYNSPSFYWTEPYMIQEEETLFSYKLEGYDNDWSKWDKILYKNYTNLSFGKYTFKVKARTITDINSREAEYGFVILKPWYVTPWMIILYYRSPA
jgi:hypothetical protein